MQQMFRQCMRLVVSSSIAASLIWAQPAPPQPIPLPVSTDGGCLIQSDFTSNGHGNFETVVLQGNDLVHYWHDNGNVKIYVGARTSDHARRNRARLHYPK